MRSDTVSELLLSLALGQWLCLAKTSATLKMIGLERFTRSPISAGTRRDPGALHRVAGRFGDCHDGPMNTHRLPQLLRLFLRAILTIFRSRSGLILENIALRQQVLALKTSNPRAKLRDIDRLFWGFWPGWRRALLIVRPETVARWHRRGFKLYWRAISKGRKRGGRPRTSKEIRQLILRMAAENTGWGAPRIHGELLKLGITISERTVSRYLRQQPCRSCSWKTFLRNHREAVTAFDLFEVPTLTFRVLYVLVVIAHERRAVLDVGVTSHPTAGWISQLLRRALELADTPTIK